MKITHWIHGDMTKKAKGSNQYKTKKKIMSKAKAWGTIIFALFAIGAIITGYNAYQADASIFTRVFMGKDPIEQVKVSELTEEQEANLAKQSELSKREIIALNKKKAIEEKYKLESNKIESELESIRAEKLTVFTLAPKQ